VQSPADTPETFRRSYTLAFAIVGNVALAVLLGVTGITGMVDWLAGVWELSPLAAAAVAVTLFYVVRANIVRFGSGRGMSRRDCYISAVCTCGLSVVAWLVCFLVFAAFGAEFA